MQPPNWGITAEQKTRELLAHGLLCLRYEGLPEFPTAMEPRMLTRWDMHRFAREAYELGVRYIGGCCGVEPHHVREAAELLEAI